MSRIREWYDKARFLAGFRVRVECRPVSDGYKFNSLPLWDGHEVEIEEHYPGGGEPPYCIVHRSCWWHRKLF